jgi:hypothetical protein
VERRRRARLPSIRFDWSERERERVRGGRPVRGPVLGFAAPFSMARHYRAKIHGATGPSMSPVSGPVDAMSSPLPRCHAWRGSVVCPRLLPRRGQKG